MGHDRVIGQPAHQFEGEIGFDRSADIGGAAGVDTPAAIFVLLAQDLGDCPLHLALVAGAQQRVHHDVVGFEGGVGFQLAAPIAIRVLLGKQKIPGPRDGGLYLV